MKKIIAIIAIVLLAAFSAWAGPKITRGGGSAAGTGSVATDTIWDTAGDLVYGTGANTASKLAIGTAYQVLMTNAGATAPAWTSTLGATGTRLTKGWFTDLEITNAPTINGAAWTTLLQPLDSDLTTIAGLTVAEGKVIIGNSSPAWSASAFTLAAPGTSGNVLKSDGTNWTSSNSLSLATLDMTSATSSIPMVVGTGTVDAGMTAAGKMYFESDTEILSIGDGATIIKLDMAPNVTYTFPVADATLAAKGTLTNTKWCSSDGTVINCTEDAPAGSGDITAVGSCTSGSCATIGNADTSGGYIDFLEDSDNGTNYVRLKAPDSTADATVTLPGTTGTLAILGANTFTADQTITGAILPEAANTRTIGSATAEWADLYLGDGAVINLGNDQDVTITHVADSGLTLAANSEDLTLAATANTWTVSSSTGVTDIKFQGAAAANAMNLATTGTILGAVKVLNAGATEGSGAHTYSPGAADIYGSMILITDSDSVTTVNLPDYQASADADHVKIGASVCVYNTVAKATIVDVAADDTITTTNGTTNAAGASVTGPATIGAFSCFMLVSASSDVGNWAQLGLNGAWPVTP